MSLGSTNVPQTSTTLHDRISGEMVLIQIGMFVSRLGQAFAILFFVFHNGSTPSLLKDVSGDGEPGRLLFFSKHGHEQNYA